MKLLRWHLGLGDALLCDGLVRHLVAEGERLVLSCWPHNYQSLQSIFFDLIEEKRVELGSITGGVCGGGGDTYPIPSWCDGEIRLGYYDSDFDPALFDREFYRQAGVPFAAKRELFKIGNAYHGVAPDINRFIHDDHERGFKIPLGAFGDYRPPKTQNITSHLPELLAAKEIHCINSSFAILADLDLEVKGKKFLHRYARPDGGALPDLKPDWTIYESAP